MNDIPSWMKSFKLEDLPEKHKEFYIVEDIGETSSYSGRAIFKVTCKRCERVIHERTNGPQHIIEMHESNLAHVALRCTGLTYSDGLKAEPNFWKK
jgi:hypothetical protein